VKELADRVTVLRDGKYAGGLRREEINHDRMVQLMVGRDISQFYARRPHTIGQPVLEVKGLRTTAWPHHASSFTVHAGEMLGVAGLVGAGRTEMLQAIFGVDRMLGGEVRLADRILNLRSCRDAIEAGVALVPEDRKQQGLILEMGIRNNIGLPALSRHRRGPAFVNRMRERQDASRMIAELQIKTPDDQQLAQYLSGGNQQKIVLAKWLAMEPRVLLLDEPTRGVDIGAKQEIYRLMEELAERGVAILFVSSEMEEVLSMSDRVIVLHEGRVSGELLRGELSEEAVMQLATGHRPVSAETT
jgi:ribose transport system ATP-binding protein